MKKDRVFIIPTQFGFCFGATVLSILMIAAIYSNNLVYLLTFVLTVIGILCMHQSNQNLKKLEVSKLIVKPGPENGTALAHLHLQNKSNEPKFKIYCQLRTQKGLSTLNLLGRHNNLGSKRFKCSLDLKSPGIDQIKEIRLISLFPMGLFYTWKIYPFEQEIYIYPTPLEHKESQLDLNKSDEGEIAGTTEGGIQFDGHRNYQAGDPKKRIDWKKLAKTQTLTTKKYINENEKSHQLEWALLPDQNPQKKLQKLTFSVLKLTNEQERFSLRLPKAYIACNHGQAHKEECLKSLAKLSEKLNVGGPNAI